MNEYQVNIEFSGYVRGKTDTYVKANSLQEAKEKLREEAVLFFTMEDVIRNDVEFCFQDAEFIDLGEVEEGDEYTNPWHNICEESTCGQCKKCAEEETWRGE